MKPKNIFLALLCLTMLYNSSVQSDEISIIRTLQEYTKGWDYQLNKRYYNDFLLDELILTKELRNSEILSDTTLSFYEIIDQINDTIIVEGYKFSYSESHRLLRKTNRKKIPSSKNHSNNNNKKLSFSYPIYSIDENIAMVYAVTYCGLLCGGG